MSKVTCGCKTQPNTEEEPRIECDLLGCECTLDPRHDEPHHCTACGREWDRLVWDPTDTYDQYLFDTMVQEVEIRWPGCKPTTWTPMLPHDVDRLSTQNQCDRCKCHPSADNPTWRYNGQPADPENGPSERDIPYALCERCIGEVANETDRDWDGPEGATAVHE